MKKQLVILSLIFLPFLTLGQEIVIFADPIYTDTSASCGAEETQMELVLADLGYPVTSQIISIDGFDGNLNSIDVLIIPETEVGDFAEDINLLNITAIQDFVNNGGILVIAGGTAFDAGSQVSENLNSLFGYTLSNTSFMEAGVSDIIVSEAAGTTFEGGPAQLPNLSGTHLLIPTLPDNSKCIYKDASSNASVVIFEEGTGKIFFLGWDFFAASAGCSNESPVSDGWQQVLESAVLAQPTTVSVPTLSQWGLIILSLIMIIFGTSVLSRKTTDKTAFD